jgi:hypothetical protein
MLYAIMDESFEERLKIFSVGILVFEEKSLSGIEEDLNGLCGILEKDHSIEPSLELHGADMLHARGNWKQIPPRKRIYIYDQALQLIRKRAVKFIVKPINYGKLIHKDPHELSFLWGLERVQELAAKKNTKAKLIADQKPEAEKGLKLAFKRAKLKGTGGWRPSDLSRLDDNVDFQDSKKSRLIQACDLVLYIRSRVVFDQFGEGLKERTPDKIKSIEATKRLYGIIQPITTILSIWP